MHVTIPIVASSPVTSSLTSQPATIAAIIALVGVLLTVIVSAITNAKLAKRRSIFEQGLAAERHKLDRDLASEKFMDEREARAEMRREAAAARRVEFQRVTLLELQEAMHALVRDTCDAQLDDVRISRDAGEWTQGKHHNDFSEMVRKGQGRTQLLKTRVLDDEIRELVRTIKRSCSASLASESEKASLTSLDEATRAMVDLNERIGQTLRKLDDAEDVANRGTE
ncbi:hypothetical protein [Sphingomonas sp. NFX23]|uniref:hypothetical protein n=1 Tax=Sphingomonas sp. NFX23 TaxID=2819532 RepID=UPI003CEE1B77